MATLEDVLSTIDANQGAALDRLFSLIAIPSISAHPRAFPRLRPRRRLARRANSRRLGFEASQGADARAARWCWARPRPRRATRRMCCSTAITTCSPPIRWSCGRRRRSSRGWRAAPTGERIVGRGAADDKGQLMTFVEACRAFRPTAACPATSACCSRARRRPARLRCPAFLAEHAKALKADLLLVCDTSMWDAKTPAITTMLRGLVMEEVVIHAAEPRPALRPLRRRRRSTRSGCWRSILADLHDANGAVTLPGFYDGVEELPEEIAAQWRDLDFDDDDVSGRGRALRSRGREGPLGAGDDLVAPDLRRQRHRRRLYRRGRQDGAAGEGERESFVPAGRQAEPGAHRAELSAPS